MAFLTSAVKGFLLLFNLDLSHHKQLIQTTLCVGVICIVSDTLGFKEIGRTIQREKKSQNVVFSFLFFSS